MGRYTKNSSKSSNNSNNKSSLIQQVVLPTYKLDSNLVLLPGIIYNVTFSRFKAAALLYRFKDLVSQVSVINNLLNEYNFDETVASKDGNTNDLNPSVISNDAVNGITQFFNLDNSINKKAFQDVKIVDDDGTSEKDLNGELGPINEFDWLTLAISPNLDRIKDTNGPLKIEDYSNVVTVVKIVGIVDDTTNIKLTLQAITRGIKIKESIIKSKNNESAILIDWNNDIPDLKLKFKILKSNYYQLYKSIDKFLIDYRQALNNNSSSIKSGNLTLAKDNKDKDNNKNNNNSILDTKQDLLTLNPLANALYLQLAGSKDFNKAFHNLQKLYSQFHSSSTTTTSAEDLKINNKTYLRLVDLTTAILPFPNYEKLKLLNKYKVEDRIEYINEMMSLLNKIFENLSENNSFANNWFHNEASNMQRANIVANQLKSIRILLEGMTRQKANQLRQQQQQQQRSNQNNNQQRQSKTSNTGKPGDQDFEDMEDENDELKAITNFIKNKLPGITTLSPDSKRLIIKDYKRIKSSANSPGGGGNSDFHVLRNYLEIVMDIPWDRYVTKFKTNKDIDLKSAKTQLDKDHYGLEHVKKRLIQYLVVLKLLGINASTTKNESSLSTTPEKTTDSKNNYSTDGNIIIANGDEAYQIKQKASNQNKQSINDSTLDNDGVLESIKISKNNKSPIIALAGPPGIGKTSIAKSIASALGRNFQRLSLGGIKDESEIRGHRRTYVGAMPGLIIQALRKARCMNPVILLDEIDKVVGGNSGGSKYNGDPSAALLEVLDPEQNSTFIDHYIGFPVDLSQVIFICTANEPYNMTRPLLDRLEMIEMGAYDYNEKLIIGKRYLLPRQIKRNGFPVNENEPQNLENFIKINNFTLKKIIIDYTREAGVRNFERKLGTICRFKAVEYCESLSDTTKSYNPIIDENDLSIYLGVPFATGDLTSNDQTTIGDSKIGVVNGLSYNSEGSGSVLVFESIGFDRRTGNSNSDSDSVGSGATLSMTGRLGETLMESGKIGLIFIKSMIYKNLLKSPQGNKNFLLNKFNNLDINMHVPMGGIPKDGPSAGITMTLSFLSVLLEKPIPSNIAMTGEITLRGLVLPIGGIKEKLLGAHLNKGINKMIVPRENRKDLIEDYIKSVQEDGTTINNNLINEILKDNEFKNFKLNIIENFYLKKYGIELNYAFEFYDVIKIVFEDEFDEILQDNSNQRLIEYRI